MQFWQSRMWVKREIALKRLDELVCDKYLSLITDWEKDFVLLWWFNCEAIQEVAMKKVREIYKRIKENKNDRC